MAFAAIDGFVTGMAVSPNGRRVYVASNARGEEAGGGTVMVIDTATAATTRVAAGELPRRRSVSPDRQRVYATDFANGSVWVLDTPDNSVVTTAGLRPPGGGASHPVAARRG